jgi:hypothetical protein
MCNIFIGIQTPPSALTLQLHVDQRWQFHHYLEYTRSQTQTLTCPLLHPLSKEMLLRLALRPRRPLFQFLALHPGILSYPTDGSVRESAFISRPTSPNSFNRTTLGLGFSSYPKHLGGTEATTSPSTSRIVIYDNFPFWSQLPPHSPSPHPFLSRVSKRAQAGLRVPPSPPARPRASMYVLPGPPVHRARPTSGFLFGPSCSSQSHFSPHASLPRAHVESYYFQSALAIATCPTTDRSTPLLSNALSRCNCLNGT